MKDGNRNAGDTFLWIFSMRRMVQITVAVIAIAVVTAVVTAVTIATVILLTKPKIRSARITAAVDFADFWSGAVGSAPFFEKNT